MDLSLELILGALAVATGLWEQVRSIAGWFAGLVISQRRCDEATAGLLISFLTKDGKQPAIRTPAYRSVFHFFVKPLGRTSRVVYEERTESGSVLLWHKQGKGPRPLWFVRQREGAPDGLEYLFSYVRGTMDWDTLLVAAMRWAQVANSAKATGKGKQRTCVVHHFGKRLAQIDGERDDATPDGNHFATWNAAGGDRLIGWELDDISGAPRTQSFDNLAVMPNLAEHYEEFKFFIDSQEWYKAHRLTWKHGWAYTGEPGTGKTTFVRELAAEFDLPVHVMALATMSDEDLREAWGKAAADAPCIILTEDIDAIFDGRENITEGGGLMSSGGLSFECLLNCIDGVERHDGVIYILTTNYPESLDEALMREGRIDDVVQFQPLDYERRLKVALSILGEEYQDEAKALAGSVDDMPASKFAKICTSAALAKLRAGRRDTLKDIQRIS